MNNRVSELEKQGKISFDSRGCNQFMSYSGNFRNVVDELKKGFSMSGLDRDLQFFLYANRALLGVIDCALKQKLPLLDLKHSIENFCVKVYSGRYNAAERTFSQLDFPEELSDFPVIEHKDRISWASFKPIYSRRLIRKIWQEEKKKCHIPDWILMDGHDGYRPGIMIASAFPHSRVCAIRNAQDSKRDEVPRPLIREEEYLRRSFYGKDVVIVGEDVSTGRAVSSLYNFLIKTCRPRKIFTAAAIHIPGDYMDFELDFYGGLKNYFD
jgi:hypoxanthine phosphoribosyltransferase